MHLRQLHRALPRGLLLLRQLLARGHAQGFPLRARPQAQRLGRQRQARLICAREHRAGKWPRSHLRQRQDHHLRRIPA